jgi:hypothetical protein
MLGATIIVAGYVFGSSIEGLLVGLATWKIKDRDQGQGQGQG